MDFKTAVTRCIKDQYAGFEGRARRPEYWWFALFALLCNLVAGLLGDFVSLLVSIALLMPSIAVGIRRLHDRDMTGWWLLLVFIPVVGTIALIVIFALPGTVGPNRFGADPINGEAAPSKRDRGGPTEFDKVMDSSYQKSRVPRAGDDT